MTLLTVVVDVCATVGVLTPTSVFSGITGNRTMQEMLSLANEMAQRICYDSRDWTRLKKVATFTGDGVQTAWDLPANYKRMLLTSNVWRSSSTETPILFVPDADDWLVRRTRDWTDTSSYGEWTMMGGQMHIWPALAVGETASFMYLDKNCVAMNGGGYSDSFQNDADSFVLDERLLKLAMIWQWAAQKGSPYAEAMGTYTDALTYAMGHDSPAPILIDRSPMSANAKIAYPWPTP